MAFSSLLSSRDLHPDRTRRVIFARIFPRTLLGALRLKLAGYGRQRYDARRKTALDRRSGHAVDDARFRALRDRESARRLDGAHTRGSVVAHAGHQDADRLEAEFLRHGMKKHINRGTMTVHAGLIHEYRNVSVLHAPHLHVTISRADQGASREKQVARLRFFYLDRGGFVETLREHLGKSLRHVLHHEEASGKILGDLRQEILQRVRSARRNAHRNNSRRPPGMHGKRPRLLSLYAGHGDDHFWRAGRASDLDLEREFRSDLLEVPQCRFLGLGDEVERAHRKSLERDRRAPLAMTAHDNHRQPMLAGDLPEHFDAIHARHLEIERHHVRAKFFQFFQADSSIGRGSHNLDGRIAQKHLRDELPHQRGVIHYENANLLGHAVAPTAGILDRCARTAGTFRMSTTLPSPRIEAPLTRGEVTKPSSSAFTTNSSSPARLSTTRPNRRVPFPIMMTNRRLARSLTTRDSNCSSRISVSTCCRSWNTSRS